jgi:hypothetical protein
MDFIKPKNFHKWKLKRGLSDDVLFGTAQSYYGKNLRSRLGAFYLTEDELVHWSYDSKDESAAIFEKK